MFVKGGAVTLLVVGVFLLGAAASGAVGALLAFSRHTDLVELPVCGRDFGEGCRTERDVLLRGTRDGAGDWFFGTTTWEARVSDQPDGVGDGRDWVSIRRQAHDDELRAGAGITGVYSGRDLLWLRVPSGAYLQTEDHARYAGPSRAALALMAAGAGLTLTGAAVATAREHGSWSASGRSTVRSGVGTAVMGIGAAAFVAVYAFPRPAPIVFIGPIAAALIAVVVLRRRGAPAARSAAGQVPSDDIVRLMAADPVPPDARRNDHLYLVARPSPRAGPPDPPHPARLAERVERLLAAQGAAVFWPGRGRLRWDAGGGGVRLTHGVVADRVDENALLIVTVAADGTVTLLSGRGTTTPWLPATSGGGRADAVAPVPDPALVLGLTRVVLLLAAERGPDDTAEWTVGLHLGGAQAIQASGRELRERTADLAHQLAGPLLGGDPLSG